MKALTLLGPVFGLITMLGCTKTGPAGLQGAQGNANVQTFLFNNQTVTATNTLTLSIPAITQGILDSGAVLGFWQPSNSSEDLWVSLPFSSGSQSVIVVDLLGQVVLIPNYNVSGAVNFKFEVIAGK
jgi:hypothetical protein